MNKDLLLEKLKVYRDGPMIPMHMPGHKRNSDLVAKYDYLNFLPSTCDITEVEGFDDLHNPEDTLKDAMDFAAKLWGSDSTHFMVNGSSGGLLSAIYAATKPHDKVIMARNCHKAVYHGVQMCHLNPIFILPEQDDETKLYGSINLDKLEKLIEENPDTKLIIITSPTYEGMVSDIKAISTMAHNRNIPLLVDEAHGSHFGFTEEFPDRAIKCGADLVVNSVHKTLPSLTQTGLLHRKGNLISEEKLREGIDIYETSSPSYLLLASIDGCVKLMCEAGNELLKRWSEILDCFYDKTKDLKNLKVFDGRKEKFIFKQDISKIVVFVKNEKITGSMLTNILRNEYNIETELSAPYYVLALTALGDTENTINALADALIEIDRTLDKYPVEGKNSVLKKYTLPDIVYPIYDAIYREKEFVKLENAVGRISGDFAWAYPPGVPLIAPGERLSEEIINILKAYINSGLNLKSTGHRLPEEIVVLQDN